MNFSTIVSITCGVSDEKVTMASSRFRNSGLKTRSIAALRFTGRDLLTHRVTADTETERARAELPRPGVRRHDQHGLAEVRLPPRVVGERRVIHHLQQDVEQVRMRLLDLVEQDDRIRMLTHGVDEQAALLEPDVARGRANQARHRMLLHVLAHVVPDELVSKMYGELLRELRLADAGRTGKEEASRRPIRLAESPRASA